MNKKIKKNIKLTGLLIGNEKKLMLCSFVSVIVGFTFMFMVSSLSGTIIKTKQDNTVNKYGKFLMVLPDIDNESEKVVQESLEKLAKNRTTLVIAHRLTTIRNAEKILVLSENGIEEQGTHDELINKHGIYYDLYNVNN